MRALTIALLLASTSALAQDETTRAGYSAIAVVGGTSFGYPPDFAKGLAEEEGSFTIETSVGESPPIYRMRYKSVPFYYIRAHGRTPNKESKIIAPTGDEYIKTWVALHDLGVQYVLGGATAGAINVDYDFDDFVIVDDFILIGNQRPQSVLAEAGIVRDNLSRDSPVSKFYSVKFTGKPVEGDIARRECVNLSAPPSITMP